MAEYDVARFEVEKVLKAGAVVMIDMEPSGAETWRVAGRDADGKRIEDDDPGRFRRAWWSWLR